MTGFATLDLEGVTVIEATGRLDAVAAPALEVLIAETLDAGHVRLIVDLSSVSYISSSGLRVLLLGARRARERGGDLKLCCLSPRLSRVLAVVGFDLVLESCASRDQALAAFRTTPQGCAQPCKGG